MDLMDGIQTRRRELKQLKTERGGGGGGGGGEGMANDVLMEEEEEPLSPGSRLFLGPRMNCCIVAMMGSGKRVDGDVFKIGIEGTLVRHPRFSSIQAIIVHFQSHMNKVKIVLTVDENLALDPHQLCMDLADSLRLMKDPIVAMQ